MKVTASRTEEPPFVAFVRRAVREMLCGWWSVPMETADWKTCLEVMPSQGISRNAGHRGVAGLWATGTRKCVVADGFQAKRRC